MKLLISSASLAALVAATFGGAGTVTAHGSDNSTCADAGLGADVHVHGDHVIRDYVGDVGHGEGAAVPGGPGPGGHFLTEGLAPRASFCNAQAHPNGFNTPDNVPVPGNPD